MFGARFTVGNQHDTYSTISSPRQFEIQQGKSLPAHHIARYTNGELLAHMQSWAEPHLPDGWEQNVERYRRTKRPTKVILVNALRSISRFSVVRCNKYIHRRSLNAAHIHAIQWPMMKKTLRLAFDTITIKNSTIWQHNDMACDATEFDRTW